MPLWTAAVAWQWWRVLLADLRAAHPAADAAAAERMALSALAGVAARFAGIAIESGFYVLVWASFGRRLRYFRFASWVVALSMLEIAALALRDELSARHAPAVLSALLVGPGEAAPRALAAFGTLGLMTALRIYWTARAQWQDLGLRPWFPLGVTFAAWSATRLAWLLLGDLARGRSAPP
jgi:hypothetical protein